MDDNSLQRFSSTPSIDHEDNCSIWKSVKLGEQANLEGNRRIKGQLMLEHPKYQYFWEIPYGFAETELEKAVEEEGVNPDLHLSIEAMIVEQLENTDPPEISEAYDALVAIGIEQHEARHVIGRVFTDMFWEGSQMAKKGQQPDEDFYLRRIRYLARHPNKVVKKQQLEDRKEHLQKGQSIDVPSDAEWKRQFNECEKAFRKALAMPNKTISDALIQGSELVSAIGAKVIFLMGELTPPQKGAIYTDELDARAAIETFREACNKVLGSFDAALEDLDKLRG